MYEKPPYAELNPLVGTVGVSQNANEKHVLNAATMVRGRFTSLNQLQNLLSTNADDWLSTNSLQHINSSNVVLLCTRLMLMSVLVTQELFVFRKT